MPRHPDPDHGQPAPWDGAAVLWEDLATAARAEGLEPEAAVLDRLAGARDPRPDRERLVAELVDLPPHRRARALVDAAGVCRLVGSPSLAEPLYEAALAAQPGALDAHLGLASVRMPGPGYYEVLERLHDWRRPASYLEIGMGDGSSMALARPPTRAVGVDPEPRLLRPVAVECTVVPTTSEQFLARPDPGAAFAGGPPDLVLVDGSHAFADVLADVIGVERIADPGALVVLHDTIPLDEPTQRAEREHAFYTGDVWKLLPCLAEARPDLRVVTVASPPSGLTFLWGLDPSCTDLADRYDELVDRFDELAFDDAAATRGEVVANDWERIVARLGD